MVREKACQGITLGIDLAAQPKRTAVCVIDWQPRPAIVDRIELGVDDQALRGLLDAGDKVGIDVPLGWPDEFVEALVAHREQRARPVAPRERLLLRDTDRFVLTKTGKRPLSVAADKIGVPALRMATLLSSLGAPVDRSGAGRLVEVYPAAALVVWQLPTVPYRKPGQRRERRQLRDSLLARLGERFRLPADASRLCEEQADAVDAFVAALVARAAALGRCEPVPPESLEQARREGWIALPTRESLDALI